MWVAGTEGMLARRIQLFVALAVLVPCILACFGPDFDPPESATCDSPTGGIASSLELENSDGGLVGDGVVVPLVTGGQGSSMLGMRVRIAGDSAPGCAQVTLRAEQDGVEIWRHQEAIQIEPIGDGFVTGEIWSLGHPPSGSEVDLSADLLGATVTRTVFIGTRSTTPPPPPPPVVELVSLEPGYTAVDVGGRAELTVTVEPAAPAGGVSLTVSSSAPSIARVASRETFDCPTCSTTLVVAEGETTGRFYVDGIDGGAATIVVRAGSEQVQADVDVFR